MIVFKEKKNSSNTCVIILQQKKSLLMRLDLSLTNIWTFYYKKLNSLKIYYSLIGVNQNF